MSLKPFSQRESQREKVLTLSFSPSRSHPRVRPAFSCAPNEKRKKQLKLYFLSVFTYFTVWFTSPRRTSRRRSKHADGADDDVASSSADSARLLML